MVSGDQTAQSDRRSGAWGGGGGGMTHFSSFTPLISCSVCIKSVYRRRHGGKGGNHSHPTAPGCFCVLHFCIRVCYVRIIWPPSAPHTHPGPPAASPAISLAYTFSFQCSNPSTTWRGKCLGGILTCCLQLTGSG